MNFKEFSFLDKSILIKFPDDWFVKGEDDNLIKVSFPWALIQPQIVTLVALITPR